jgi:hypothetical protein
VRHQRRVLDQALDAAQTLGQREQPAVFQEALGARKIGLQHNRHHAAEGTHLTARQRVLRVRRQARVVYARDLRLLGEPVREVKGVGAMSFHAQRQCLQAAQCEKAVERADDAADGVCR